MPHLMFFSLRPLTNNSLPLEQSIATIWKRYRKSFHYYDYILTRNSQPQSIFQFLLM